MDAIVDLLWKRDEEAVKKWNSSIPVFAITLLRIL